MTRDTTASVFANNKGELVIREAGAATPGEYVCHAKNIAGHAMMDINIEVISGESKNTSKGVFFKFLESFVEFFECFQKF